MIETPRLLIKRTEALPDVDLYVLVEWLNNAQAMRYSEQRHIKHSITSQRRYIKSQDHNFHIWDARLREGNALVGTLSARFDRLNDVADVGILIGPPYQGTGYGREAWDALIQWLLQHECVKVECGMMSSNHAMMRMARKRMNFEGERPRHFIGKDGARYSLVMFGSR